MRDDVYMAATDDGVRVLTHRGLARIDGTSIGEWIERLTPFLDGGYTIEDLTAGLPPDRGEAVKRVIELLRTCDAVQEVPQRDDDREARYLERAVVIAGVEPMLEPLVRAASVSGLRNITVMRPDAFDPPEGTEIVFYAGDGLTALPLQRACAQRAIPLALMVHTGDAIWLLPPGTPGWDHARRRMGAAAAQAGTPPVGAAALLVHAVFRALTGAMPPAERGRLVRIEQGTWTRTSHSCLPHPFARTASVRSREEFLQQVRDLLAGEPFDHASFLRRIAPCNDEYLGVFTLTEVEEPQIPLNLCRAVLPDGEAEIGAGFGHDAARRDAVRKVLAVYGARTVDPRRLAGSDGRPLMDAQADPDARPKRSRTAFQRGYVWGYEIDDPEKARLLPAADVFGRDRAGLAAGDDWERAVGRGLADQCLQMTMAGLASRSEPFPRIDVTAVDLHEEGRRCRDILTRLDGLPEVYDLTGPLGVPTFACCSGEVTIGYFTDLDPAEALGEGLRSALLRLQSTGYGEAEPLPDRLRGPWRRTSTPATDMTAVVSRLRARRRVAIAIPLDHDPEVAAIMPYLTRVVVRDA
ncbi:YcaO-like family protein [Nonomuraea polychroma]|uniref:YcaO-like family protein n=1 Tax=Nonomuraea polychroma TaxID=46176 RepID=UPI000FDCF97E|nr:YcaO-like family protein [Nonomuraea polychroma]